MKVTIGSYRIAIAIERIPFSTFELRQRYDDLASQWGSLVERLGFADAYHQLFQQLKRDGYLRGKQGYSPSVLDCGIGAGDLSLALEKALTQTPHLSGIDLSAAMLTQASQRLLANGNRSQLQQANMTHLPFPSRQFDLVMSAHTLEHLSSPDNGLQEMVRVIKPNGLILIVVTQPSLWGRWIQHRWRVQLHSSEALKEKLRTLGLNQIRCYPVSGSVWSLNGSVAIVGVV